jgi:hypothetical protein
VIPDSIASATYSATSSATGSNEAHSSRLFSKGSRSTKKSNGFFFVVTSNLLNPAAMNVLFPAISALNHFSTVDPRRYVTADGRIDESHG